MQGALQRRLEEAIKHRIAQGGSNMKLEASHHFCVQHVADAVKLGLDKPFVALPRRLAQHQRAGQRPLDEPKTPQRNVQEHAIE